MSSGKSMAKYIGKRLLLSVVILLFVTLIIYTLMRCLPTSYIEAMARQKSMQPGSKSFEEWMEQLSAMYNMDKGIIEGFFAWLGSMLRGEFGDSWKWTVPVAQKFNDTVWVSFAMGAISFVFQVIIAIPLGIIAATKQYSKTDYAVTVFALIGISIPGFFFATILKYILSVKLGWLDLYGAVGRFHDDYNFWGQMWDTFLHYLMPILTLTVTGIGSLMRYTRTNMLEVLNSDYIRTARAKGLPEKTVINKHAFRNTLIPLVTILGGSLPGLFGGAMITETIFQIPGIGYTSYQSIIKGDIPFAMFYLMFSAILILVSTFITDILYAVVDPRVRVQ